MQKEWLKDFAEGICNPEWEYLYSRGREAITNGKEPYEEELEAYQVPKLVHYAQTMQISFEEMELMDEAKFHNFVAKIGELIEGKIFDLDECPEDKGDNRANWKRIAKIEWDGSDLYDWQEQDAQTEVDDWFEKFESLYQPHSIDELPEHFMAEGQRASWKKRTVRKDKAETTPNPSGWYYDCREIYNAVRRARRRV